MLPGFTVRQYSHLTKLVNEAAKAQEREHNERNAPDSTPACNAVEEYASRFDYTTDWATGLYPSFLKDGKRNWLD